MAEAPSNVVQVAKALARLGLVDAVFVGGATIPLLLTDAGAVPPRVTYDVDVVVDLRSRVEFYRLEKRLREAGYSQPVGGPICRWTIDDVPVDLMPVDIGVLGFTNRWYGELVRTAQSILIVPGRTIRVADPGMLLVTKLEAYQDRGGGDFVLSHDITDVVTLLEGRQVRRGRARRVRLERARRGSAPVRQHVHAADRFLPLRTANVRVDARLGAARDVRPVTGSHPRGRRNLPDPRTSATPFAVREARIVRTGSQSPIRFEVVDCASTKVQARMLNGVSRTCSHGILGAGPSLVAFVQGGAPMYVPHAFRDGDIEELAAFMRDNAFAMVVSSGDGGVPVATHVPVTATREGGTSVLRGHFAKANPHWRCLEAGETLVVFTGPHAYVSPRHYEKRESVPTWNYRAVHAYGHARITERNGTLDGLHELIAEHEADYREQWDGLSERYREGMLGGIVGFEIVVDRLEGAAKLSQNKSRREQERIADALVGSDDHDARATGCEMHRRRVSDVEDD